MNKKYGAIGCLAILVVAASLGPQVDTDISINKLELPDDLDLYLAESESHFNDITEGTEKTIIWEGEPGEKTRISIVSLHGFSATRQELSPLADTIAESLNANLFYTRLAGHGRGSSGMIDGSINGWVNDANEALLIGDRIGDRVVLIGTSTGSTLATWLAIQPTDVDIAAIILMSPNYYSAELSRKVVLLPWGKQIAETMVGKERHWEPQHPLHEKYWANDYPTAAILPMVGLVNIVDQSYLEGIKIPTLMIYSSKDKVISLPSVIEAFQRMGSPDKQLVEFNDTDDPDFHALAGDLLSPSSTAALSKAISTFIKKAVN